MELSDVLATVVKHAGVPLADLSTVEVEDRRGRADVLVSMMLAEGVRQHAPGLVMLHQATRPLVDGLIHMYLGGVKLPTIPVAPPLKGE